MRSNGKEYVIQRDVIQSKSESTVNQPVTEWSSITGMNTSQLNVHNTHSHIHMASITYFRVLFNRLIFNVKPHFTASSMKDLFDNVAARNIINFIKESHFIGLALYNVVTTYFILA